MKVAGWNVYVIKKTAIGTKLTAFAPIFGLALQPHLNVKVLRCILQVQMLRYFGKLSSFSRNFQK